MLLEPYKYQQTAKTAITSWYQNYIASISRNKFGEADLGCDDFPLRV